MKSFKILLLASLLISIIALPNCGPKDPDGKDKVNAAKAQALKLAGTWTVVANGAELEGDIVAGWDGFTITFDGDEDGGAYSTTGAGSDDVWPASGTWVFEESSEGKINPGFIVRSDDVVVSISSVTSTKLFIQLEYEEPAARLFNVSGTWDFELSK